MASKETWTKYQNSGVVGTDEELVSMISDMVVTIRNLEKMYVQGQSMLTVRALLQEWHALSGVAFHRGIMDYERP